ARMPCMTAVARVWSMVVPVKRLAVAKSRLAVEPAARADLALAVTDDARAAVALAAAGANVTADVPDSGLNPALRHGAAVALAADPAAGVAALSSDLPALQPADLAAVLSAAADHRCAAVADLAGDGTTVLTGRTAEDFEPAFG